MCLGSLVLTIDTSVYISYKAIRYKLYVYKWLSLLPKGAKPQKCLFWIFFLFFY